jgi:hypothetical protein
VNDPSAPLRVLLVMPAQWPRALLRAALREVGYDASGARDVDGASYQASDDPTRGPVRLIVIDQDALPAGDASRLETLRQHAPAADLLLLAPATRRPIEGPWRRVIRRPASMADLVQAIEAMLPLPPDVRRPLD